MILFTRLKELEICFENVEGKFKMNNKDSRKEKLIKVFEDTLKILQNQDTLKSAVQDSIKSSVIYEENNYPALPLKRVDDTIISVNKYRTFETAQYYAKKFPNAKIAVLNFASATNVGGGVTKGSSAQEESLCRTSTLYPVLNTAENLKNFYEYHRKRGDSKYTDRCIYTSDIFVIKSDTDFPEILPESKWIKVDVITCAAPNLRINPNNAMNPGNAKPLKISDKELYKIHVKRAKHILTVAAHHQADILILGAFGCGAFRNNPKIVAEAYKEALKKFSGYFQEVVFAVYCSPKKGNENYIAFNQILKES